MPHFKAPDDSLHFLSPEDVANGGEALLPIGCVPVDDPETVPFNLRRSEILAELQALDARSIRPAREVAHALASGQGTDAVPGAVTLLAELETQAQTLRDELAGLT